MLRKKGDKHRRLWAERYFIATPGKLRYFKKEQRNRLRRASKPRGEMLLNCFTLVDGDPCHTGPVAHGLGQSVHSRPNRPALDEMDSRALEEDTAMEKVKKRTLRVVNAMDGAEHDAKMILVKHYAVRGEPVEWWLSAETDAQRACRCA